MQQKKNDPCFWSWIKWLLWPSFVQDQKPSRSFRKWEKRGRDFECVFFQNLFKISEWIFEASFFFEGGGLAKKNTAVFSLEYFFLLVRWSGRGSATGNNFLANPKTATKSYSRSRAVLSVRDCSENSEKETTKIFIKKKRPKEALFCNRKLRSF